MVHASATARRPTACLRPRRSDIDTTTRRARWYWNVIRDNYVAKGFDAFWADETEPDLPPTKATSTLVRARVLQRLSLFTPPRIRRIPPRPQHRALILARDAYLGAQHNGAIFWSSDIYPNWDTLKRQVPTGINFVASACLLEHRHRGCSISSNAQTGAPAADRPQRRARRGAELRRLPGAVRSLVRVRCLSTKLPQPRQSSAERGLVLRQAGRADSGKYLRLRYTLMPYIYSLAYRTHQTGAPFMRDSHDFGDDPMSPTSATSICRPALLVAPSSSRE